MVNEFFRRIEDAIAGDDEYTQDPYSQQPRPASEDPYGDPAGHSCLAVDGPVTLDRLLRTSAAPWCSTWF